MRDDDGRGACRDGVVRRLLGEYEELPGLSLTADQIARLFMLERRAAELILETLVIEGTLRRATGGHYILNWGAARDDRPRRIDGRVGHGSEQP